MFEKNGWEAPETWDDFMALIPKIKEKGIAPLVTGGKDSRFAWMASAILVRSAGLDNFKDLCFGEAMTKWDDPQYGFVEQMKENYLKLLNNGLLQNIDIGSMEVISRGEEDWYYRKTAEEASFLWS